MKTRWILIGIAASLVAVASSVHAQDLTEKQRAVARAKQQEIDRAQLEAAALPTAKPIDQTAAHELTMLLLEAQDVNDPTKYKVRSSGPAAVKIPQVVQPPQTMLLEGGGGGEQELDTGTCGQNPNRWYNLLPFDMGWGTISNAVEKPWHLSTTTITGTNGYGAESYPNLQYPNYPCRSTIRCTPPNDFDMYGDAMSHALTFSYQFWRQKIGDEFYCNIAGTPEVLGIASTNLPDTSGLWRRTSLYVRPDTGGYTHRAINFVLFKNNSIAFNGSTANLDPSMSWCAIPTPLTSLRIVTVTNVAVVQWNIPSYNSNRWDLEFAGAPEGPYAQYAGPVNISNGLAWVSFPKTNDYRFYRLKHK